MRQLSDWIAGAILLLAAPNALAACTRGAFGDGRDAVAIADAAPPAKGQAYSFVDGRRGTIGDDVVRCDGDRVTVRTDDGRTAVWPRIAIRETPVSLTSDATKLYGLLVEPTTGDVRKRPRAVLVHGSEKWAATGVGRPLLFAAMGVSAFVYDKRGTGASDGDYTQNFELLADDAAAAFMAARQAAAGRFGRIGYFGGSQGGWVAPLAASRTPADFVAIGYGLAVSPIDEDREQMELELAAGGYGADAVAQVRRLSTATAVLMRSHFTRGYEELAAVRRDRAGAPWARTIEGEYSGDMLRMSDADLRRVGRARFDNLELIWDYDAAAVLDRLKPPLLWILAGKDREAPIADTKAQLDWLAKLRKPLTAYVFPDTDHGILEFTVNPDGSRKMTRVAEGYFRLLTDWMKGTLRGPYGRAQKLH